MVHEEDVDTGLGELTVKMLYIQGGKSKNY